MKDQLNKPPVGIMPEKLFEETRIIELAAAITRYVEEGYSKDPIVQMWSEEITCRLKHIEEL